MKNESGNVNDNNNQGSNSKTDVLNTQGEKNESKEVIEMNQDFYQAYLDPPDALNDDIKPPKPGAAHRSPSILDKSSYQDQKRFLLDLAMAFHLWGAPAYYTEAKVAAAGYSFGTKNFKKCVFKRNIPQSLYQNRYHL